MELARVGDVYMSWSTLLFAVTQHAEKCPAGELAFYDAERLEATAKTIRIRLKEWRKAHGFPPTTKNKGDQ